MRISSKQKITLGLVGGYVLALIADPFVTVARLNVETWAQEKGYDKLYRLAAHPPEWLVALWDHITGPFGLGFSSGALLFAFWDPLARYGRRLFTPRSQAQQALDDLFAEGVKHRNRLLKPLANYDDAVERGTLSDWGERVLQKLDYARVPVWARSRFRTLNLFDPEHRPIAGRDLAQVKLESIWNEKLRLLREILDGFDGNDWKG